MRWRSKAIVSPVTSGSTHTPPSYPLCMTQGGPDTAFDRISCRRLVAGVDHRMRSDNYRRLAHLWMHRSVVCLMTSD